MADRPSEDPTSSDAAAREARRATADMLARIAAQRRRARLVARLYSRETLLDVAVAMATYTGVTVAVVIGAIYGIRALVGLLIG